MAQDKEKKAVCFTCGDMQYAIPLETVYKVILHNSGFIPVPGGPYHVLGVIVFEGDILPVISIERFFKKGRENDPEGKREGNIVIIEYKNERAGIFIEGRLDFCNGDRERIKYIRPQDFITDSAYPLPEKGEAGY